MKAGDVCEKVIYTDTERLQILMLC